MEFTRSKFISGALALVLSLALVVSGCSFQTAIVQLNKYLPIAVQAFEGVLSILVANGAVGAPQASALDAKASEVQGAFADLQGAINAYNAAPADQKQAAMGKVLTAVEIVNADLSKFEGDIHISNPKTQATVQAAVTLIATTLAAIEVGLQPTKAKAAKAAHAKATIPSAKEFKAQYNRIVISGGYPAVALK